MPRTGRTIETKRLILRPFAEEDVGAYAAILAKPDVVRHLPGGEARAAQAEEGARVIVPAFAALWMSPPHYGPWAAVEKGTGCLLGHLGLRHLPDLGGETELLYMLDSTAWGAGLATEGARAACDFAFKDLNLPRLIAMVLPANMASIRVLEKIGMIRKPGLVNAFGLQVVRFVLENPFTSRR